MPEFSLPFESASEAPDDHCPVLPDKTYIYALLDPRDGRIRYAGKANNPALRFRAHLSRREDTHCRRWLRQLVDLGLKPVLRILEVVPRNGWQAREQHWIAYLKGQGCQLTNVTEGGEGCQPNEESRAKMRAAKIGWKPKSLDHLRTPECRAKQSEAAQRRWARMTAEERGAYQARCHANRPKHTKGHPQTAETRAKISATLSAKRDQIPYPAHLQAPEVIQKRAEKLRGRPRPLEVVAKVSARHRKLSVEQVAEIRRLLGEGRLMGKEIAVLFGTTPDIISRIRTGKIYVTLLDRPPQESSDGRHSID